MTVDGASKAAMLLRMSRATNVEIAGILPVLAAFELHIQKQNMTIREMDRVIQRIQEEKNGAKRHHC